MQARRLCKSRVYHTPSSPLSPPSTSPPPPPSPPQPLSEHPKLPERTHRQSPNSSATRRRYSQFSLPGGLFERASPAAVQLAMSRRPSLPDLDAAVDVNEPPRHSSRLLRISAQQLQQQKLQKQQQQQRHNQYYQQPQQLPLPLRHPDRDVDRSAELSSSMVSSAVTATHTTTAAAAGALVDKQHTGQASFDMLELMTEVQDLWDQINSHITVSRTALCTPSGSLPHLPQSVPDAFDDHGDALALADFEPDGDATAGTSPEPCETADSEDSLSSQGTQITTMSSLRRRLNEKEGEYESLRRQHTLSEIQSHRLEETVHIQQGSIENLERDRVELNDELVEVRHCNDSLAKRLESARYKHRGLREDHSRQQRTMDKFREELVSAHQNALNARLEAKRAKERATELEKQQRERRMSSEAISSRIVELKAIHDEMLMLFSAAEENAACLSNGRKRNMAAQGGERRSGMLNQLRKILSPKGPETDKPLQLVPSVSGESTPVERQLRGLSQRAMNGMNKRGSKLTSLASTSAMRGSTDGDGVTPKSFLCGIPKTNTEGKGLRLSSRSSRAATMLASIERTRAAVEKDTQVLRELVTMKDGELERIRNELYLARRKTESLEKALATQKQKRRKESRRRSNSSRKAAIHTLEQESSTSMLCLSQSLMEEHDTPPHFLQNELVTEL